jgi:secreted Zn-dependent insulinase-like peptidase
LTISHPLRRGLTLLLTVLLTACAATAIEHSPNDSRSYEYLALDNGLKVLLVSDPDADKSAAALAVFRGSFDDPPGRGGLAHFLEHMLFLGTEKYPETDEYQNYISTHGGSHNAYTAGDHTNFFFDIQPAYFEGALDRFAQFFIAPRFDAAYVDREKNAVNSEYQLYLKEDGWRGFHVEKQTMNPQHPGSAFTIGSLDTLAGDVRSDLIRFYEQHYSADQMALVVLSNESLPTLRERAVRMFTPIPRRALPPPTPLPPLYAPGALPAKLAYRTIKESRELSFNFPVPPVDPYYRTKPGDYVSNLLGHEGEGSLHALLKDRGWIESLSASAGRFDADNALITVNIELTEAGSGHEAEITQLLFETIGLIARTGVEPWRYDEQARVAELSFRFQEMQSPLRTVYSLAPNLRLYPAREVLIAPYLMTGFDEGLIRDYLAPLRPDNVLIEVANQTVATDRVEPYFQVPYRYEHIAPPAVQVSSSTPGLALPAPNPFLPEALGLIGKVEQRPELIMDDKGMQLWLARDTSFGAPRADTYLGLELANGLENPLDWVHATLYARLVEDRLNAYSYPAALAGLSYRLNAGSGGFLITLAGFNDKQPELLARVLEAFAGLDVDPARLGLYQDELRRDLQNFTAERPYQQAYAGLSHLLVSDTWPPELLANALTSVTPASLAHWRADHLQRFKARALMHGNVDATEARELARVVRSRVTLADLKVPDPTVAPVTGALAHRIDAVNQDATMVFYVQGNGETFRERALYGLAAQVLSAPYYTELRTERQLGYVVFASPAVLRRTPGIAFTVQSPVAGTDALIETSLDFLTRFRATLAAMPTEEFEANKKGLVSRLLEKDKNLAERTARYWSDLEVGFTEFDSRERIAKEIQAIDKASFIRFFDALVTRAGAQRLIVYSPGKFESKGEGTAIDDVAAFKQGARAGS